VSSDAQEAARIRVMLRDLSEDVLDYQDKLADVESQIVADSRAAERLEKAIGNQREILTKEQALLGQDKQSYEIQGRTYTRKQVEEDALSRISHTKTLERDLDLKREVVARLNVALTDGRKNLGKAMATSREKAEELKVLEVRLHNARKLGEVAALGADLRDAPLAPRNELAEAFRGLKKRVRDAERRNDVLATEARGGLVIDWDGGTGLSATQALDEFLSSSGGVETPLAEVGRPEVAAELSRALGDETTD